VRFRIARVFVSRSPGRHLTVVDPTDTTNTFVHMRFTVVSALERVSS